MDHLDKNTIKWYPMRVTYSREMKVKECLDKNGIENFIPMHYEIIERDGEQKKTLVPAVHNLIFLHSSQNEITEMKRRVPALEPLRYTVIKHTDNQVVTKEILTVPDKQMADFMRVASNSDEGLIYLDYNEFIAGEGVKVMIVDGPLAGVEGKIRRIKNNKRVVVEIEGFAAVAIGFVPGRFLKKEG